MAEPLPKGFGFSDTAFRIFVLMASRRLKSDRFLSKDYRPEVYTKQGIDWVENTTMIDVLQRHFPASSRALEGRRERLPALEAGRVVRRTSMAFDAIFQPLQFRNLTVKNRIFRSNVSGRFDNYDGSGNQARINWETKFAKGGVGAIISSFVPVHLRGRIVPNYAMIDHDRHIPFWRAVGERGPRARLQVHHAAQPRRPAARHQRHRVSEGAVVHRQERSAARLPVRADDDAADQGDRRLLRRGRAAGARGRPRRRRAARRQRLPDHAVPQLGDQRPQGRVRRLAREPRPLRARDRRAPSAPRSATTSTCR